MSKKIIIDEKEYCVDDLSDTAKSTLSSLQFVTARIQELTNMQALLTCAKNTYADTLKREILSNKAGLIFGDE